MLSLVIGRFIQVPEWDVRVDVQTAIGQNMSDSYTQGIWYPLLDVIHIIYLRIYLINPRSGPCSLVEVWSMMCPSFRVSLGHFSEWVLQLTKISAPKTLCPYHWTYTIRIRIFTFCLSGSPGAGYRVKSCWWMTDIGFCLKYEGLQWLGGLQWLDACFFT